jgi:hypothetical protein
MQCYAGAVCNHGSSAGDVRFHKVPSLLFKLPAQQWRNNSSKGLQQALRHPFGRLRNNQICVGNVCVRLSNHRSCWMGADHIQVTAHTRAIYSQENLIKA